MDRLDQGESCCFEKDFKDLPMKDRVNLIKTAKNLLEVQKESKGNVLSAVPPGLRADKERIQGVMYHIA